MNYIIMLICFYFTLCICLENDTRRLSLSKDWETGVNVRTVNGQVPFVPCPIGSYRIIKTAKTNHRIDGCILCPRGRYGSTIGLTSSMCSGACSRGRYGDFKGASSPNDCTLCPFDSYGPNEGSTNPSCVKCPLGTYNPNVGSTLFSDCKKCPPNYFGNQCSDQLDFQNIVNFLSDKEKNNQINNKNYEFSSQIKKNSYSNSNYKTTSECGKFNNVCYKQHVVSLM